MLLKYLEAKEDLYSMKVLIKTEWMNSIKVSISYGREKSGNGGMRGVVGDNELVVNFEAENLTLLL